MALKGTFRQIYDAAAHMGGEMINSGMHCDPPNTSYSTVLEEQLLHHQMKNEQPTAVTQALANAATTIASALSPAIPSKASSPGVIDHCSKKHSELRNLHTSGILTNGQYKIEKKCVLELLRAK